MDGEQWERIMDGSGDFVVPNNPFDLQFDGTLPQHFYEPLHQDSYHLADDHVNQALNIQSNPHPPAPEVSSDSYTFNTTAESAISPSIFNKGPPLSMTPVEAITADEQSLSRTHTSERTVPHEADRSPREKLQIAGIADPGWSGEVNTSEEANNFLNRLSGDLRRPQVDNDDATYIRDHKMAALGHEVLQAIVHSPGPSIAHMNEATKVYYHDQQAAATDRIRKAFLKPEGQKTGESRALVLIDTAIKCHTEGLPAKHFEPGKPKVGFKSLTDITCGERVKRIISCVRRNKLAALDVLAGRDFLHLAMNPDHFLGRKESNVKSNGNKPKGQRGVSNATLADFDIRTPESHETSRVLLNPKTRRKSQGTKPKGGKETKKTQQSKEVSAIQGKKRSAVELEYDAPSSPTDQRRVRSKPNDAATDSDLGLGIMTYAEPPPNETVRFGTANLGDMPDGNDLFLWDQYAGDAYAMEADGGGMMYNHYINEDL